MAKAEIADARSYAAAGSRAYVVRCLSAAFNGRLGVDGRASLLLQRDLLHLRARPDRLLRDRSQPDRLVYPAFCRGEFLRTAGSRAAVRHLGTPPDDYADLWDLGHPACALGLSFCDRRTGCENPDYRMDGALLLRFSGRKCRLPHGQRNLSAGGACIGDRAVLRGGNRNRWCRWPPSVRRADRYRLAWQRLCGLSIGCGIDAGGINGRLALLYRGRAAST